MDMDKDKRPDEDKFDLESILKEFSMLGKEPDSETPAFESSRPITDTGDSEDLFSALVTDEAAESESAAPAFDPAQVLAEFDFKDEASAAAEPDREAALRKFLGEELPEPEKEPQTARQPTDLHMPELSFSEESESENLDRIIAEFRDLRFSAEEPDKSEADAEETAPEFETEPETETSHDSEETPGDVVPEPEQEVEEAVSEPESEDVIPETEAEPENEPTVRYTGKKQTEPEPDLYEGSGLEDEADGDYASDADYSAIDEEPVKSEPKQPRKSFREAVMIPIISAMAFLAMKIKQNELHLGDTTYESEELGEEMSPADAAKHYDRHIAGLRLRTRISFVLCVVMAYISLGLPVFGALTDAGVKSAVCLVLMIGVMLCGLDIITTGVMSLARLKFHASSLIAVSCILCMLDAFLSAFNVGEKTVAFCVVPSLTIAFTLLGCVMNARSCRIIFNTATAARKPYTLTAQAASGGDITLVKARSGSAGIVRRTEEEGPDEAVFGTLTPYFIAAALLLSLIAAIASKGFASFAHILSGIFVCAAPISMLLSFPLPFFVSSKSLITIGAAIAGWSGLYDIGKAERIIVTDADLFPRGCVKISKTRVFSGMRPEKCISFAASIISASGSAMAQPFRELMRKANGRMLSVENFIVHESGGLTAMVDGESVCCGGAAFMRLMGVPLPEKYVLRNGVYCAASGVICGVFELEYIASDIVKASLTELMSSGRHPVFAVRDFNITPQLLSVKFDMPTDGLDFPPFSERYELSGAAPAEGSKPAAIISREGLGALVRLSEHGGMLFERIRLNVLLSVLSSVIGMLLMFIISLSALPSVVTALIYLLVCLLATVVVSFTIGSP